MASICGASIFSPSPTPACYQQHGSRLPFCAPQRMSFPRHSEGATPCSWSSSSSLKAQVVCASGTIELPASSKTSDTAAEVHEPRSRLSPLVSELIEGAHLPSAVEPWLDKLSVFEWQSLVRDVGDKDWAMAWQLVSHFKEKAPVLSDSVLWPQRGKKADGAIDEEEVAEEGDALLGSSAAEIESKDVETPLGTPEESSAVQRLYKALVKVLSKNKRSNEIDQLHKELKAEGIKPVPSLYYAMLKFYLSENLTANCSNLVSEMEQAGINISLGTYEKIALDYMKEEPLDLSVPTNIMRNLMNKGLPVSHGMLKNLLKAKWRNKDVEGVEEVLQTMQAAGHTPDQKAILKVMNCQKRAGNYERILELMEMMANLGITPNIHIYDELIYAYCKAGLVEKAKESFSLYDEKLGKKPTLVAFNTLIHGYGKQGHFEEALQAFEDIQNNDHRPDAVSYSSVIAATANAGQLTKALQLYRRMVRQGMQPKLHTLITLIHGLKRLDWTREGRKIVNAMRKSPHLLTPEAFGAILSLFVDGHWYHLAASVLMEMEKERISLNADASSVLIRSFGILGPYPTPLSKAVESSNLEICKLLSAAFLMQSDDGGRVESVFEMHIIPYLEKLENVDDARVVYNAFMDCLWKRGQKSVTGRLLRSAREVYAQSTKPEILGSEWVLDARGLSVGGAKCALSKWLTWVVKSQIVGCNSDAKIAVSHEKGGLKQSTFDAETIEDSKKFEVSKMVIVMGKEKQLNVSQDDGMLKMSIARWLVDLKSPFVESSEYHKKLEAPAADVRNWAISDEVKKLIDINDI